VGFLLFAGKVQLSIFGVEVYMPTENSKTTKQAYKISLDTWAVALGLLLAVLVRFGAVKHIPW
jgi:hypothetical protein